MPRSDPRHFLLLWLLMGQSESRSFRRQEPSGFHNTRALPSTVEALEQLQMHDPLENRGVTLVNGHLVEGDIRRQPENQRGAITPEAMAGYSKTEGIQEAAQLPRHMSASHQLRNAKPFRDEIWTDRVIPYALDPSYNINEISQIHQAMSEIMEGSGNCVTFVPRTYQTDFIYITAKRRGCYSDIGRQGGNQTVSLSQANGCVKKGIVMHELLHVLGFWHEHTRYDRDHFIRVLNNNIADGHLKDFEKQEGNLQNISYDYYSIMHYSTNMFAKDSSLKTIEILNASILEEEVGQRKYLSEKDKARIKALYECPIAKCVYPKTLNDESVQVENVTVGSRIVYSCTSTDLVLVGATERTCLYDGTWSGSPPLCFSRSAVPFHCDFETPGQCGWTQDVTDEADWTRSRSHTNSSNTGPLVDHTKQNSEGFYMYLEGSGIPVNYSARLLSPLMQNEPGTCILAIRSSYNLGTIHSAQLVNLKWGLLYDQKISKKETICTFEQVNILISNGIAYAVVAKNHRGFFYRFWYNMYGVGMGTMKVKLQYEDSSQTLWSLSGNQNFGWKMDLIAHLNPSAPYRVVFEAIRGPFDTTDMAIDDVMVGSCHDIATYQNAVIREHKEEQGLLLHSCNFDTSNCGWFTNSTSGMSWHRQSGATPSLYTGPSCDKHNCTHGSYLYFETSGSHGQGTTASISSPTLQGSGFSCVVFNYHMYGTDIGNLSMFVDSGTSIQQAWSATGNLSNVWLTNHVQIRVDGSFKITMVASKGGGYRGDIAFDNVDIYSGRCPTVEECNFDARTLCDLHNDLYTDDFDWKIAHGNDTLSSYTGPRTDHTKGSGHFIYIEASSPRSPGDVARLLTPYLPVNGFGYCVSFWYFMYGQDVASLKVKIRRQDGSSTSLWEKRGDFGPRWIPARVSVPYLEYTVQIVFEAIVGQSYKSDIALDDVEITEGKCSSLPSVQILQH